MSDESDAVDIDIEDGGGASDVASEDPADAPSDADSAEGSGSGSNGDANARSNGDATAANGDADAASDDEAAASTESEDAIESASVVDRLEEGDDELAAAVRQRLDTLEEERDEAQERADDLEDRLKRTQADFQNYKKRAKKRQQSIQNRATEDLVERLVPVRDNLQRALDQDEDADIREGVESTLTELDRVLEEENVEPIEPEPGEEVDPHRHEVLMRVESDQPAETIAESYRPGYEMDDKVIREAQVTVSDGGEQ